MRLRLLTLLDAPNFGICLTLVIAHVFAAVGLPAPRTGVSTCQARGCQCSATAHSIDDCCCGHSTAKPGDFGGSCCKPKRSLAAAWEASKCRSATVDGVISHAPTVRPYELLEAIRVAVADEPATISPNARPKFAPPPVPPPKSV